MGETISVAVPLRVAVKAGAITFTLVDNGAISAAKDAAIKHVSAGLRQEFPEVLTVNGFIK